MKTAARWIIVLSCVPAIICSFARADLNPSETRIIAIELGATPEALSSLGFTFSTAQEALARLAEQESTVAALRQRQQEVVSLRSTLASLNREARAASEPVELDQINAQIVQKSAEVDAALGQMQVARAQLITAIVGPATDGVLAHRVFEAGPLPAAYRVAELNASQRSELQSALAAERRALARGESVPQSVQQTLVGFRSLPAVSMALGYQSGSLLELQHLFMLMD